MWVWINVFIISVFGTIPFLSSTIMGYIGTACCFTIQLIRIRKTSTSLISHMHGIIIIY